MESHAREGAKYQYSKQNRRFSTPHYKGPYRERFARNLAYFAKR